MGFITPNDYDDPPFALQRPTAVPSLDRNQIMEGLSSMIEHAHDTQFKQAFQSHKQETEVQVQRLESLITELTGDGDDKKDQLSPRSSR